MTYYDDFDFSLFDKEKLPVFPAFLKPEPSELFSSWLVRLSHAHHMKVYTFTRLYFSGKQVWNRDIDRSVPEQIIKFLAQKTNCTFNDIYNTTLRSYEGKLFEVHNEKTSSKWILPLGVYHRTWKNNGLMFCPGCLSKDGCKPYYRKQWRLSLSVICPDCECYLQNECPKCSAPVSFFRSELGQKFKEPTKSIALCFNCAKPLSKSKRIRATNETILMQNKIYSILEQGCSKEVIYSLQFFDVMKCVLKIFTGKRKAYFLAQNGMAKILKTDYKNSFLGSEYRFDLLPVLERAVAIKMVLWLFEEWPYRFIKFFKDINFYSSDLLRDAPNLPFWYYSVVYNNFYASNVNRRFIKQTLHPIL